jgi:hypothetical protein
MAWGAHGLGFEAMESTFVLSGGVLPTSKCQYALTMKNLVHPNICPQFVVLLLI